MTVSNTSVVYMYMYIDIYFESTCMDACSKIGCSPHVHVYNPIHVIKMFINIGHVVHVHVH